MSVCSLGAPRHSCTSCSPPPSFRTRRLCVSPPPSLPPLTVCSSLPSLRSQHYLKLPVQFRPGTAGTHAGWLLIQSETSGSLAIQLTGEALP